MASEIVLHKYGPDGPGDSDSDSDIDSDTDAESDAVQIEAPAEWTATRSQACGRGYVARDNYRAAKQAKAAASRDESANQLVVGSTILGRSIINDEPLYGGKCACVALLTGVVPPCLGGSVTVFHDAAEAFYYMVWDYFERYFEKSCDVF